MQLICKRLSVINLDMCTYGSIFGHLSETRLGMLALVSYTKPWLITVGFCGVHKNLHDPIRFALLNSLRLACKCTKNRNGSKQICLSVRRSSRHSHVVSPIHRLSIPSVIYNAECLRYQVSQRRVSTMFKRSIEKTKTAHIFGCFFSKKIFEVLGYMPSNSFQVG